MDLRLMDLRVMDLRLTDLCHNSIVGPTDTNKVAPSEGHQHEVAELQQEAADRLLLEVVVVVMSGQEFGRACQYCDVMSRSQAGRAQLRWTPPTFQPCC
ncbi:hypothetical protein GUJ93_ZPchr0012g21584 [Zizania palustris]|uniref:Uncharacterized protein n=1 Tax=Zizania palustris TaxID=103762 RepID=A0A8J6BT95_ZIZPA|nr:hypothetical protein GUJ93_ZPchr0012g21584 [Zizania palustris]